MKFDEFMELIKRLAQGVGFYSRLYNAICCMADDQLELFKKGVEEQNFKDAFDVIMHFEC